jgi:hypothetical protein
VSSGALDRFKPEIGGRAQEKKSKIKEGVVKNILLSTVKI